MWNWLRNKQQPATPEAAPKGHTDDEVIERARGAMQPVDELRMRPFDMGAKMEALQALRPQPVAAGKMPDPGKDALTVAMDSADGFCDCTSGYNGGITDSLQPNISGELAAWFGSQGFIGHQLAALVAQHWLVWKACSTPSRDAIRNGFDIVNSDGDDVDDDLGKYLRKCDKSYGLMRNLRQFVTMGRVFGIRICLFKVESSDPDYYIKPFNPDGVTEGSYKGIVQVDPYWTSPILSNTDASQPDAMHFYEPTWWLINGKRYHRTHLVIFRNGEVADILKPQYLYGGMPIPQLIMERVYGSERTANEAPLLALTKRTNVYKTDLTQALAQGWDKFANKLTSLQRLWNNQGVRVIGDGDEVQQLDTALSDLDAIIMTQYQLVAAAANVPSTKLLGTAPKGFNATGEYDESNYHEELESLQTHDLSPLVDRHHKLCVLSAPAAIRATYKDTLLETVWHPLDTPTAKEVAEINKLDAEADLSLQQTGAIGGEDIRKRIASNKQSNYSGIATPEATATVMPDAESLTAVAPTANAPQANQG